MLDGNDNRGNTNHGWYKKLIKEEKKIEVAIDHPRRIF